MRRRILLLVFTTTLFALTLLGVVLMTVIWQMTTAATQSRAVGAASQVATAVHAKVEDGVKPTVEDLEPFAVSNGAYVVVGTGVEPEHEVRLGSASGEDQHRQVDPACPQGPAHVQAVDPREAQVEQHQVGRAGEPARERGRPVRHVADLVALTAQGAQQRCRDVGIVLGHDHARRPGRGGVHRRSATATAARRTLAYGRIGAESSSPTTSTSQAA